MNEIVFGDADSVMGLLILATGGNRTFSVATRSANLPAQLAGARLSGSAFAAILLEAIERDDNDQREKLVCNGFVPFVTETLAFLRPVQPESREVKECFVREALAFFNAAHKITFGKIE